MSTLTIRRRAGQAFRVGPDIVVRIEAIEGRRVKVSIGAPREVTILREELFGRGPSKKGQQQ